MTAFKPFGFEGILDIIHAVTSVFFAAMADRTREEGWTIYRRWITWIWQGAVSRVIEELNVRSRELGEPTDADKDTSPRRIVASTRRDLENHQQSMNYPRYRELGLPLTSSVMESMMTEMNYRVKGTEKFWKQRQQTRLGLHARARQTA